MNAIVECEACHFQWLTKPLIIQDQPWPDFQDKNCHTCPGCGDDRIKMLGFSPEPNIYRCPDRRCRSSYILMHATTEFRIVRQPNGATKFMPKSYLNFDKWCHVVCGTCGMGGQLYEFDSMNQSWIPLWHPDFKHLGLFNKLILAPTCSYAGQIKRESIVLELGASI